MPTRKVPENDVCCLHLNFRSFSDDFLLRSIEQLRAECVLREVQRIANETGYAISVVDKDAPALLGPYFEPSDEGMWGMHLHGDPEGISCLLDTCDCEFELHLTGVILVPHEGLLKEFDAEDWDEIDLAVQRDGDEDDEDENDESNDGQPKDLAESSLEELPLQARETMFEGLIADMMNSRWLVADFSAKAGTLEEIRAQVDHVHIVTQLASDEQALVLVIERTRGKFSLWVGLPEDLEQDFQTRIKASELHVKFRAITGRDLARPQWKNAVGIIRCKSGLAEELKDYFDREQQAS